MDHIIAFLACVVICMFILIGFFFFDTRNQLDRLDEKFYKFRQETLEQIRVLDVEIFKARIYKENKEKR